MDTSVVWQQCLSLLKEQLGEQVYNTWLVGLSLKLEKETLNVVASNRLVHDFIKNKFWDKISQVLCILGGGIPCNLVVAENAKPMGAVQGKNTEDNENSSRKTTLKPSSSRIKSKSSSLDKEILESLQNATKLNSNYTFDNLVKGNSNQLAYAIGLHVTQQPGNRNHNPLFIYGGVGLGKTHLMQAIGNEVYHNNPKAKIRYLHANDYIQDVVKASMRQGFDELKKYYNSLDLLLMDDIQFIAGDKTKTQEEFFYTFNTLLDKGKQVIMTCDTYPRNINNLNERLISRFASGLTVEIQPPELEMRVAILKCKAEQIKINLDDEVAFFIAQNVKSNVRELEGALNKVVYQAQFSGKGISLHIAKEALIDILAIENRNISIDEIQKAICDFYKIKLSDLLSAKRTQLIAKPRQIAMTLAKELTQHSLPAIGAAFGGRDHTTVLHAQKTIKALKKTDNRFEREYNLLLQMLNN
ncbi:MAG: chromosomal replication initiator protein DnaA [Burkholderiales bacterium]|nr:chromosomal replication initiator protein DnaA [Burkholderiales bacterium]